MLKLENLNLNKKKDSNQIYLEIKSFIDKFSSDKVHLKNLLNLSSLLEIPKNIIEIKFKRLVYNQFNPETCKFNNMNSYRKIVNSFFQFISIFFFVILVGSNKKRQNQDTILL